MFGERRAGVGAAVFVADLFTFPGAATLFVFFAALTGADGLSSSSDSDLNGEVVGTPPSTLLSTSASSRSSG